MDIELAYNGLDLASPFITDIALNGLFGSPAVDISDASKLLRNGVTLGRTLWRGRTLTLAASISADDATDFAHQIGLFANAFAVGQGLRGLIFTVPGIAGGEESTIEAEVRAYSGPIDLNFDSLSCSVVAELFAPDARLYVGDDITYSVGLASSSGGESWGFTWPMVFGGSTGGDLTIVNEGNVEVFPVVKINGPITSASIVNQTSDLEISLPGLVIPDGSFILIDMEKGTVLLDGQESRAAFLDNADFWSLLPGSNQIHFTGSTFTSATAEITTRSAYI